jgi:hypothetical protein
MDEGTQTSSHGIGISAPHPVSEAVRNLRRGVFKPYCGMPKHVKKSDLPEKVCAGCARPFLWRKKWAKVWNEVRYCSDRCRNARTPGSDPQ